MPVPICLCRFVLKPCYAYNREREKNKGKERVLKIDRSFSHQPTVYKTTCVKSGSSMIRYRQGGRENKNRNRHQQGQVSTSYTKKQKKKNKIDD
jgi:hypothetical protein